MGQVSSRQAPVALIVVTVGGFPRAKGECLVERVNGGDGGGCAVDITYKVDDFLRYWQARDLAFGSAVRPSHAQQLSQQRDGLRGFGQDRDRVYQLPRAEEGNRGRRQRCPGRV